MSSSRFNPVVSPPFSFSKPPTSSFSSFGGGTSKINSSNNSNIGGTTNSSVGVESPMFSPPVSRNLYNDDGNDNKSKLKSKSNDSKATFKLSSRALSCQSPDSQSIHSLIQNHSIIQTQTLPLHNNKQNTASSNSTNVTNATIQTKLPSWLISSLHIDPPTELLCIDNDVTITSSLLKVLNMNESNSNYNCNQTRKMYLPLLCIYTSKSIYILQISITSSSIEPNMNIIKGTIESIHEPIESYIHEIQNDSSYNYKIQRVRSATSTTGTTNNNDSTSTSCPLFIPRGCIAILLSLQKQSYHQPYSTTTYKLDLDDLDDEEDEDDEESEMYRSKLILYHGVDNDSFYHSLDDYNRSHPSSSNHHSSQNYNLTIMDVNTFSSPIIDFTFLNNGPSSLSTNTSKYSPMRIISSSSILWNGMTIVLSSVHSELYTMSPIIFHNMALSKHLLEDGLHHLHNYSQYNINNNKHTMNEKENESNQSNVIIHSSNNNHIGNDDEDARRRNEIFARRNKAAAVFIKDVFGISNPTPSNDTTSKSISTPTTMGKKKRSQQPFIVTANILNHSNKNCNASSWPIAIQGPIYKPSDVCIHDVVSMESLPSGSLPSTSSSQNDSITCISGYTTSIVLACGKDGQCVQYVMIPSGVNFIPRFAFESDDDCQYLDGVVDNSGMLIEELVLEDEEEENKFAEESPEMSLIHSTNSRISNSLEGQKNVVIHIDPIDNSMIHHFSKYGVVTITTNCHKVIMNKLRKIVGNNSSNSGNGAEEIKTQAWSTIDILQKVDNSSGSDEHEHVVGINICSDAKIGHILVAVLSNGKLNSFYYYHSTFTKVSINI